MDDDKRIDEWLEHHDGEDYCHYCILQDDCDGRGVRGGPNGPIYPPCCDLDYNEELLDDESLLEDLKSEEASGIKRPTQKPRRGRK